MVPENVAALPMFADLLVHDTAAEAPVAVRGSDRESVVGDVVTSLSARVLVSTRAG